MASPNVPGVVDGISPMTASGGHQTLAHSPDADEVARPDELQGPSPSSSYASQQAPSSPTAKRLACERCHNQKLRCARQRGKLSCDRCIAANSACAERKPRRLGRPHSTNSSVSKPAAKRRPPRPSVSDAGGHAAMSAPTPPPPPPMEPVSAQAVESALKLEPQADANPSETLVQTAVSSIPERRQSPWPLTGLLSPSDCPTPFDWDLSDAEKTTPEQLEEACRAMDPLYPGPLVPESGEFDALMPSFDDITGSLLVAAHPHVDDQMTVDNSSPTTSMTQDPVERLTSINLELYQCLNSFKSIEAQRMVERTDGPAAAAALHWVERLFQAAEEFVEILKQSFTGDCAMGQGASPASSLEDADSFILDSATGLMVISCYVRLLQIFDSFASVLPATLEAGYTINANLLGLRIGSFCPTLDKRLSAVFVIQYVYHLLDSICGTVENAVGTQTPHGPTLVEARNSELKLRERLSSGLNMSALF